MNVTTKPKRRFASVTWQMSFIVLAGLGAAMAVILSVGVPLVTSLAELVSDNKQIDIVSNGRIQLAELFKLRRQVVETQVADCTARHTLEHCVVTVNSESVTLVPAQQSADFPAGEATWWLDENTIFVKNGDDVFRGSFSWQPVKPLATDMSSLISTREHLGLISGKLQSSLSETLVMAAIAGAGLCLLLIGALSYRMRRQYAALSNYIKTLARGSAEDIPAVLNFAGDLTRLATDVHGLSLDLADAREKAITKAIETERMSVWQTTARKMAHEIKNPLTPISLVGEQLSVTAGKVNNPQLAELLTEAGRIISEETTSLDRMVKDFTAFARLPKPERSPQNLHCVLDDFVTRNRCQSAVTLNYSSNGQIDDMHALVDASMLHQIFHNLVNNARWAADPKPVRVTFTLSQSGEFWTIDVTDNGPGVPLALRQTLFDAYVTSRSTGDREKGMGLGLTICRQIATDHGGDLRLLSTSETGTTMRLTIPRYISSEFTGDIR